MASFKTHLSSGVILAVASVVATVVFALIPTTEWQMFFSVAFAVMVGAIAPDIDSDSGIPFHVTFGLLALVAGELAFLFVWKNVSQDPQTLFVYPVMVVVAVWAIIGPIFKKLTRHRGMAHSIPAAIFAGLLLFTVTVRVGFQDWEAFLLGVAFSMGYILHLVLDELNSAVNFHGTLFVPNKALGSALKFFSHSRAVTAFVYISVAFLFLANERELSQLAARLYGAVRS